MTLGAKIVGREVEEVEGTSTALSVKVEHFDFAQCKG